MGVDITHIIKHQRKAINTKASALNFAEETIGKLKEHLFIDAPIEDFELLYDDEFEELTFQLPIYDMQFTLHKDFWQIESFFHYVQLLMHTEDYFELRCMTFDIARALGEKETWYAEEYLTWNSRFTFFDSVDCSLNEWLDFVESENKRPIAEFDPQVILLQENPFDNYETVYHDSFVECHKEYEQKEKLLNLHGYHLLGLTKFDNDKRRCVKDGCLQLI